MDKAHALLQGAAAQFRFYEAQHRAKLGLKPMTDLETEDTVKKADVNAEKASEIEQYLLGQHIESVRSPDAYATMVAGLQKPGIDILAQLTPLKIMCLHMAGAAASEGGELFDAIKRWALFGKDLDVTNVIEELGDLEFFMEGLRQNLNISRQDTLDANMAKLGVRYEGHVFSDEATIARADKQPDDIERYRWPDGKFHSANGQRLLPPRDKNLADAPQSEVDDAEDALDSQTARMRLAELGSGKARAVSGAELEARFKEEAGLEKDYTADSDQLIDVDALGGTTDGSMR